MSNFTTIICLRNSLARKGLEQLISLANIETDLIFCKEIKEVYQYKTDNPIVIFLDQSIIPNPCVFCLDKVKSAFQECKLIALADIPFSDDSIPYFEEIIYSNEAENKIAAKIYKVYKGVEFIRNENTSGGYLSNREIDILKLVALGYTNKEIGDRLNISIHTVITHRKNITAKLGIKTIAGLTVYAILNRIISSAEVQK